ncbi:hypothetical protein PFICI_05096 [Pestalotiopsis fici W106-1]|uniref:Beta-glucuronidase C-terminal domain-containing protein n=1 Tax=Pestalotiopsis fici (strain W106-1 / CGMCC3.15140) TaxID=1229662 RepID=W3XB15_PESFW|nr:uncharacterized protein PFICI_05096 [Pestalotiopsis fici W106-1]ETS83220.1 hypothetical protein PFICI_05096 [Pestalotiopsis fici W106-1]
MKYLPLVYLSTFSVGAYAGTLVSSSPPANISGPVAKAFLSYSIEFAWFAEYSGNLSHPNTFTNHLLNNFNDVQGHKPYLRVGGNTQDNALFDPLLKVAVNGTFGNPDIAYPTTLTYGESFFEGYQVFDNVKFSQGFNLGANGTVGFNNLKSTLPLACKALNESNLAYFEIGNEADQYASKKSNRGPIRAAGWNVSLWLDDWRNRSATLESLYAESGCENTPFRLTAPSFAGKTWIEPAFEAGFADYAENVTIIAAHSYVAGANSLGVTLQDTLMNHATTKSVVDGHVDLMSAVAPYTDLPYMIGEGNSLSSQGKSGVSNSFGAALWNIDFALYAASVGIWRIHLHNGVGYNYAAWHPSSWNGTTPVTKAPYYGNIATAATLGNVARNKTQISSIPMSNTTDSAYAIYKDGSLASIAILNMAGYNYTKPPTTRPSKTYSFSISDESKYKAGSVKRLMANGSDAITGITWDGYSYNYNLANGKPSRLTNITNSEQEEPVKVINGAFNVTLPHSSFTLVELA